MTVSPEKRGHEHLLNGLSGLLEEARRSAARAVNRVMTATYWEVGRRIVEFEQGGEKRADYGDALLERLASDMTARFGRGFSRQNLQRFRQFYSTFPPDQIRSTPSSESAEKTGRPVFPLPWSHYVLLIGRTRSPEAVRFYHAEALRGGWSVRQLDRQISSHFYGNWPAPENSWTT